MSEILAEHGYLADDSLATSLFLALRMGRPLLLEGEAGSGKTEVAHVLARWSGGELVRLQCYDGIDASQAVYEWDYARQLLHLRAAEMTGAGTDRPAELEHSLYSEEYLVRRPLLRAIAGAADDGPVPILLIDEIDRADDEFEAYLLEILSDFTVTVPELGTFRAQRPPVVILTSNRTRDVHDALKRRCLYHWVDYPSFEREVAIDDRLGQVDQRAGLQPSRRANGGAHPRHRDQVPRGRRASARVRTRRSGQRGPKVRHVSATVTNDLAALATGFSRSLRASGLDVAPSASIDFAEALALLGTERPEHVFWAGHACFCRRAEDAEPYAETFRAYFGHAAPIFPRGRLTTVPPVPVARRSA